MLFHHLGIAVFASFVIASFALVPFAEDALAKEYTVDIPFGAYDPNVDTPAENWYDPPLLKIEKGDTVTWKNNDIEAHTVTSGEGTGRFGWMGGEKFGQKTGLFDSGRFMPDEEYSKTFDEAGLFNYFCTIHPWMEGVVYVGESLPDYPHDAEGNRIDKFPIIEITPDGLVELDLSWEPKVLLTQERAKFIYQAYDPQSNSNLDKMQYDIVIIQNGKEVFRDEGLTGVGGDYRNFVFDEPGPVKIRFENIVGGGTSGIGSAARQSVDDPSLRTVEFTTIVYQNPDKAANEALEGVDVGPARRAELQYELLVAIIVVPGALAVIAVLKMMYGKEKSSG